MDFEVDDDYSFDNVDKYLKRSSKQMTSSKPKATVDVRKSTNSIFSSASANEDDHTYDFEFDGGLGLASKTSKSRGYAPSPRNSVSSFGSTKTSQSAKQNILDKPKAQAIDVSSSLNMAQDILSKYSKKNAEVKSKFRPASQVFDEDDISITSGGEDDEDDELSRLSASIQNNQMNGLQTQFSVYGGVRILFRNSTMKHESCVERAIRVGAVKCR